MKYNNLRFAKLDTSWLNQELMKCGDIKADDVFLCESDTTWKLSVDLFKASVDNKPEVF